MTGDQTLLEGHTDEITALVSLPSGWLASASYDNTIRVWDRAIKAEIIRLDLDAAISSMMALPGGRLVAGDHFTTALA